MKIRRFIDLPIREKFTLVSVLISAASLVLAGLGVIGYELWRFRTTATADLSALARIISENSAAALTFSDSQAARETLETLKTNPDIISAAIYDRDGNMFVQYQRGLVAEPTRPPLMLTDGYRFEKTQLVLWQRITVGGEDRGMVCLRQELGRLWTRLRWYGSIVVVVMLLALAAALLLAAGLQRVIADPILQLADVARGITQKKDYSLRAVKRSRDETGLLMDAFNQMLTRIEDRDKALQGAYQELEQRSVQLAASEEQFRQVTENIREVFWLTDPEKDRMIYISPGYERIWGRSRESLYQEPQSWLDAIHPVDRERVRQAAVSQQVTGVYDEEYRIVRPDGAVRWVRDRAFPVRDDSGTVFRVAGIAEDVTDQLQLEREILRVSDREQRRIGQDLHDGLCQHLVGTAFANAVLAEKLAARSLATEVESAREIGRLLDQAVTQARALARGLHPVNLDAHGLSAALQHLASSVHQLFAIPCLCACDESAQIRDNTAATHLYRIAQEAIHNAVKHGSPRHIWTNLRAVNGDVILTVKDDGVGFAPLPKEERGMGLHLMAYRARMIGATLEVRRGDGHGTIVTCNYHAAETKSPEPEEIHAT